ncbi:MAG TPA: TIGR03905 family protein [Firmicutes bacterium]|nr:TIGR03905 family protein [Bacillota bacterium]
MKTYIYNPQGVCSRQMKIVLDDNDTIVSLEVLGGCNGNLKGISALVKGRKAQEVIEILNGIRCHDKSTSCPDQLSKALVQITSGQLVASN